MPLPWAAGPARETVLFDNLRAPGVGAWNLLAVTDPEVSYTDERWTMLLGAFENRFRVRLVQADLPPGRDAHEARWRVRTRGPWGTAVPLARPPRGAFDSAGMGSPCLAEGVGADGEPARRVYYTGLDRLVRTPRTYAIGVLEETPDGGWRRRGTPVLRGDAERPSVLEPCLRYADGRWHLWFLSFVADPPRGQAPDYRIRYAWSEDGLTGWSDPLELFDARHDFFDVDVRPWRDGWLMVLAGDPHAEAAPQGLWLSWSSDPGDRTQWHANLRPLLTHDETAPDWRGAGVYGPSIAALTDQALTVFVSGRHLRPRWLTEARRRLRERRLPPPPFGDWYLSVTRLEFDAG